MFILHWWRTSTVPSRILFVLNTLLLILATGLGILSILWVNYDPLVGVSPKLKSVYPTETYEVFMGISMGVFLALVFLSFFGCYGVLKENKLVTGIFVALSLLTVAGIGVSCYYQFMTIDSTEGTCNECYQCDPGDVVDCEAPAKNENKKCLISTDVCVGLLLQAKVVLGFIIGAAAVLFVSSIVGVVALVHRGQNEYRRIEE